VRYDVRWGQKRRRILMFQIQAKMNPEHGQEVLHCAECDRDEFDKGGLHINHIDGKDWESNRVASHTRTTRYMREFAFGARMNILCGSCNNKRKNKPSLNRGEVECESAF
jgi:hypothetical protein